MGLTIHYNLSLPATTPLVEVQALFTRLLAEAKALPVEAVSELVHLEAPDLTGPWPVQNFAFSRIEDVVDAFGRTSREHLYHERLGIADHDEERPDVPLDLQTTVIGFVAIPGEGCEPAALGLTRLTDDAESPWRWWSFCKTQYASALGDDHFLRCHRLVIALLDAAKRLGIHCEVIDESGYFDDRDTTQLVQRVDGMNRLVAQFGGALSDAVAAAGGDSRQVQGEIFHHPDFERLEMSEPKSD